MRISFRTAAGLFCACALSVFGTTAVHAQPSAPATPPCVRALIALIDPVNSANAHPGDEFRFRIVDETVAPDGTDIPAGNIGYGVVAFASHANRGGVGGYIALEPRFIRLADGTKIDVFADRLTTTTSAKTGSSNNAPFYLGAIPLAGYLLGPYGYIHHGSDTTLPVGLRLTVLVGSELALGECHIPQPNETPVPIARRQAPAPSPAPSGAPVVNSDSVAPVPSAPVFTPAPPAAPSSSATTPG